MTVRRTAVSAARRAFARRGFVAAVTLSAAATAWGAAPPPAAAPSAAPTRVAIVNTQRVFNDMQETKALNTQMGEETKKLEEMSRGKQANLQRLQKERDESFKPGTPQWDQANEALMKAAVEFEVWGKTEKARTEFAYKKQVKQLFDKVQAATAEVAQKEGFDLVLADVGEKPPEDLNQLNLQNLKALMLQRNVLFAGPKNDVTSLVILVLDAKYKASGGK